MNDQADALRQIVSLKKQTALQSSPDNGPRARVVAVTSGKGGVGKTSMAVNLAVALGQKGLRVLILDADFGLSNVDVLMGVNPPYDLSHVLAREKTLRDIVHQGPGGVQVIAGGSGLQELISMSAAQMAGVMERLSALDEMADIILIDTAAGLSRNVTRILCTMREILVVVTPDPTSIMDAYALVKMVQAQTPPPVIHLLVNRADTSQEARETAVKFAGVARLYLKADIHSLGYVLNDPAAARAVKLQRPFVLSFPNCRATRNMEMVAGSFLDKPPARPDGWRGLIHEFWKPGRTLQTSGGRSHADGSIETEGER